MANFILGIDAGATKVVGRLEDLSGAQQWHAKAGSASLTYHREQTLRRLTDLISDLLGQSGINASDVSLVIGIAGACNSEAKVDLEAALKPLGLGDFFVTTDAITSLYGAGKGQAMIATAVGTGSVAMRLDYDGQLKQFGGWGFVAGDQGGGADIGRNLVKMSLKRYDAGDYMDEKLVHAIIDQMGHQKHEILNWLSSATPADFGSLARLLMDYPDSLLTRAVIRQAGYDISDLIRQAQIQPALAVCLLGGLADVIAPWLDPAIQTHLVPAQGSSLDGALYLAKENLRPVMI